MGHAQEESGDVLPLILVMGRLSALAAGTSSIQAPRDGAKHFVSHGLARPGQATTAGKSNYSDDCCFVYGDTFAFMVFQRMQGRRGAIARPPVICRTHVQGLGQKVDNQREKPAV